MSQANIPNITPEITVTREESQNLLLSSIAMEELGLAHIINAEAEKVQFVLGTLNTGVTPPAVTLSQLFALNDSVQETLQTTIKQEMLLQFKLENVLDSITVTP